MKKKKTKYPISKNNIPCIGPCYDKSSTSYHPDILSRWTDNTVNLCPSKLYIKDKKFYFFDECTEPSNIPQDILSYMLPNSTITSDYFIKICYNINNLEELLIWLESNSSLPYRTKERVFNNGMIEYGKDLHIIDQRFVDHISYILHYNLHIIYNSIRKYIKINKDKIELLNPIYTNKNDFNDDTKTVQLIRHYIKKKFLNPEFIYKYISKFIRYYKTKLTESNISNIIIHNMIDYIIKCINLSFD